MYPDTKFFLKYSIIILMHNMKLSGAACPRPLERLVGNLFIGKYSACSILVRDFDATIRQHAFYSSKADFVDCYETIVCAVRQRATIQIVRYLFVGELERTGLGRHGVLFEID